MAGKPPRSETVTQLRSKDGDEELTALFQEWLIAFEKTQSATGDEEPVAALALSRIESRIATTPAEGLRGVVVKLGLDRFLRTPSEQADSAYADLVRLTGHDPVTEILAKLRLEHLESRGVEVLKHFYQVGQTRCAHFSHGIWNDAPSP